MIETQIAALTAAVIELTATIKGAGTTTVPQAAAIVAPRGAQFPCSKPRRPDARASHLRGTGVPASVVQQAPPCRSPDGRGLIAPASWRPTGRWVRPRVPTSKVF